MSTQIWWIYLLLCFSGIAGGMADWGLNQWVETRSWWWWLVVALGVGVDIGLFLAILSSYHFSFGVAIIMSLVTHCLTGLVIDHLLYGKIYGFVVWSGIFLGIVAMVLMELGNQNSDSSQQTVEDSALAKM